MESSELFPEKTHFLGDFISEEWLKKQHKLVITVEERVDVVISQQEIQFSQTMGRAFLTKDFGDPLKLILHFKKEADFQKLSLGPKVEGENFATEKKLKVLSEDRHQELFSYINLNEKFSFPFVFFCHKQMKNDYTMELEFVLESVFSKQNLAKNVVLSFSLNEHTSVKTIIENKK